MSEDAYRALLGFRDLVCGGVATPAWQADGSSFLYRAGALGELRLFDAAEGRSRPVAEPPAPAGERPRRVVDPYPSTTPPLDEVPSPDGARFLTVAGPNLAVRDAGTDAARPITFDGEPDFAWVLNGASWSPGGEMIAALRVDTRDVSRLPLTHWRPDVATVETRPFPIAAGPPVRQALGLLSPTGAAPRIVWAPDDGQILQIAGFDPGGRELRFLTLSRDHRLAEFRAVDAASGACRLILAERAETFLYWWEDVFQRLKFYTPLSDGRFVWASERSGFSQIYLYDGAGGLVRQLTDAPYPVERALAVDEVARRVFFLAHPDARRPYDTHLMRVGLDGRGLVQLTDAPGQHEVTLAPSRALFVDTHSSVSRPPCTEARDADGCPIETLGVADVSALEALGWSPPEPVTATAADGRTTLAGVLYKPIDFDPARQYPVVEYIYGGGFKTVTPHGFFPSDARGVFLQALAQLGFIGVIVDARGTPGRSKAFQDVVHKSFGEHEAADHAAALRDLAARRPYMDLSRVGIFGISFGGYFTVRALLQQPELYRVGVALSPAEIGPATWDVGIAPYLGLAADNPDGYARAPNAGLADRLAGELLLIAGSNDVNTPLADTMRLADAFVRAGKPVDMLVVPEANHAFAYADGRSAMPYVLERVRDYFVRRLAP